MPSNQPPEDVRERWLEALCAEHEKAGEGPLPIPNDVLDAVAPLIIEWARKDQAEVDAGIADSKAASGFINGPGAWSTARAIRGQFTHETTGGKK